MLYKSNIIDNNLSAIQIVNMLFSCDIFLINNLNRLYCTLLLMYFKMYYKVLIVILAISNCIQTVFCANILAFFPLPTYSHYSGFHPLFLELANRGHHVTVVSPFHSKENVSFTYTHVLVPSVSIKRTGNLLDIRNAYRLSNMINVKLTMMNTVKRTLELKEVREFLNNTEYEFDLILNECWYSDVYLAVGHRYSAPVVCLSPMLPSATLSSTIGIPNNPSFVPSFWLRYADTMSFIQRLYNTIMTSTEVFSDIMLEKTEQNMLDDLYVYPGHCNCPPLNKLKNKIPLTLINTHYSVSYSRPYPPNVIPVAGMHMTRSPAKIDNQKLKKLLDDSVNGVIYFSFGSNIKMSMLPKRDVRVFVNSFKKLSQIVLWKWENGTIENLPNNVYVDKWFPQQYILSHKNCKLFITHGGYHSLVEALNFGLPVIGFPFFTDQYYNTRFVVQNGFGIEILLNELKENILDEAIEKTLFNLSYKENAQKSSKIFLDLSKSALDTAVYWVEYVIRNEPYYKVYQSYDLNWYQYLLLDGIILFTIVLILTVLFIIKVKLHLRK